MERKTFTTSPGNAIKKIEELINDGWTIIASANTSTPETEPDAHGVSYGGSEVSILAERKYDKPKVLAGSKFGELPISRPCDTRPGGSNIRR